MSEYTVFEVVHTLDECIRRKIEHFQVDRYSSYQRDLLINRVPSTSFY